MLLCSWKTFWIVNLSSILDISFTIHEIRKERKDIYSIKYFHSIRFYNNTVQHVVNKYIFSYASVFRRDRSGTLLSFLLYKCLQNYSFFFEKCFISTLHSNCYQINHILLNGHYFKGM